MTDVSSPRFGEARGEGAPKGVVLLVVHEPDSDGTARAKRACGFEGADALPLAPPGCFLESVTSVLVPVPAPRPHCQHTASPHCELNKVPGDLGERASEMHPILFFRREC